MKKFNFVLFFVTALLYCKQIYTADSCKIEKTIILNNNFLDQRNAHMECISSTQCRSNNQTDIVSKNGQICNNQPCPPCQGCLSSDDINISCKTCDRCVTANQNSLCPIFCDTQRNCPLPPVKCRTCPKDCDLTCNGLRTVFIPRSQGANTARELVGWQDFIYRCAPGCNFFVNAHTFEYTHSFRPERIARILFGTSQLDFAGSLVADRTNCEIISDYFGLSPNFRGTLNVETSIQNYIFDNQIFFGFNTLCDGTFIRAHMPIVHTIWNLNTCETNLSDTCDCPKFPACSMAEDQVRSICSILRAFTGDFAFGDLKRPIQFGKICPRSTKTGVADIDLIFGWNFWQDPVSHFGIYTQVVIPTGNKPNGRFIFQPIIGNGKHWELGGGISGHLLLWTKDADKTLTAYIEGNVTHMFKNTQCRSFDLCPNGPLSRYILLKEFEQINDQFFYNNNLINAINFTTRPVESTISVKGDVSAKLSYRSECFNADIGYNFYGQTEEKVKIICPSQADNKFFGVKGTADVCALEYNTTTTLPPAFIQLTDKIPLNSSESNATITCPGTIDNPEPVQVCNNCIAVTSASRQSGLAVGPDILIAQNSSQPVLLSINDLDINSGKNGAIATHKLFAHVNYIFTCCPNYIPYFGVGGEFEVEALACNEQTSLNQWGVWFKFGASF